MKKIYLFSLTSAVLLFAPPPPAYSQDEGGRFDLAGNLYASVSFGQSEYDFEDFSESDFDTADFKDTSLGFSFGYLLEENFGVELGYRQFGEAKIEQTTDFDGNIFGLEVEIDSGSEIKVEASGWTLGGSAEIPISDKFVIGGRLGLLFWDADGEFICQGCVVNGVDISGNYQFGEDDSDMYFGLMFGYKLGENATVSLGYSTYSTEYADVTDLNAKISFRF